MKEPKTVAPSAERAASPASAPAGMDILLRGGNPSPGTDARPNSTIEPHPLVRKSGKRLLRISLVFADLLLVALVLLVVNRAPHPLGLGGTVLCAGAIVIGAWLACLALWLGDS
jgi:hypothetical protein